MTSLPASATRSVGTLQQVVVGRWTGPLTVPVDVVFEADPDAPTQPHRHHVGVELEAAKPGQSENGPLRQVPLQVPRDVPH